MLDLLVTYAREHNLVVDPGFKPKDARWAITFESDGTFTGVIPLVSDKKPRTFPKCPDFSFSALKFLGGKGAHFLITECQVLVLLTDKGEAPEEKFIEKNRFFVELLRQAGDQTGSYELCAVGNSLANPAILEKICSALREAKGKATDKATIRIGEAFPIESDTWHDWWRTYQHDLNIRMDAAKGRTLGENEEATQMICFASGDIVVPARLHPKVTGLADVGGNSAGAPFAGYDKDAFCSYGLLQSANGSIGEESAFAYRAALDHLLKDSVKIAGMKIAHWFNHVVEPENDPLSWLVEDTHIQETSALVRARDLLTAIRDPKNPRHDLKDTQYYALSISGAAGRVMVRDWMDGSFERLAGAVSQWFEDLSIVNYQGSNRASEPKFGRVITCVLPTKPLTQSEEDWIKPVGGLRIALWRAALQPDRPIPFAAISMIMAQHRKFMQSGKIEDATNSKSFAKDDNPRVIVSLLQTRMSLIKAYHNRKNRGGYQLESTLKKDHPDAAYHCGRLMATLAQLQQSALGDVGAGVVQRFYGAASATPALVLGRLVRGSQHHLNKLESNGLAYWYEQKIAEILSQVNTRFPRTLTIEEQSLFALGYYHQMAADRTKKPAEDSNPVQQRFNGEN